MAELVLALGLLATILISMVGLFTTLLGASTKSTNQTVGAYFAKQKLEEAVLAKNFNVTGDEGVYAMDSKAQTNFHYRITSTDISGVPGDTGYKGGYYVQITVYWWGGELAEARAGKGLQYTTLGRFVYPGTDVP